MSYQADTDILYHPRAESMDHPEPIFNSKLVCSLGHLLCSLATGFLGNTKGREYPLTQASLQLAGNLGKVNIRLKKNTHVRVYLFLGEGKEGVLENSGKSHTANDILEGQPGSHDSQWPHESIDWPVISMNQ